MHMDRMRTFGRPARWLGLMVAAAVLLIAPLGSSKAFVFFFQAEDGIRDATVTEVQTCALPISGGPGLGAPDLGLALLGVDLGEGEGPEGDVVVGAALERVDDDLVGDPGER